MKNITNCICYNVKNPMIVNKDTKYEKILNGFLCCYTSKNTIEAAKYVQNLNDNIEKRKEFCKTHNLDFDAVADFYLDTTIKFDTSYES